MLSLELLLSDREYEAVDYLRVKAALLQEHDIDVSQPGLPPQNAPKCIQTVSGLANSLLSKKPTSARLHRPIRAHTTPCEHTNVAAGAGRGRNGSLIIEFPEL